MSSDIYKVKLDGIECSVTSFETLRANEPGDIVSGTSCLDSHQYLSLLFANLGYNSCPDNLQWITNGIDIKDVSKTEVLDYPITKHRLGLYTGSVTLYHLLIVIANWIHGGIEKGRIVDPIKSSKLPNRMETQFNLENNMMVKRRCFLRNRIDMWDKSNIFMRRQYNLSPEIDSEYFDHSFIDFESISKIVRVYNPTDIFTSCLINPDIFFSIIRESEILAYKNALEKSLNTYSGIPDTNSVLSSFLPIFKSRCDRITSLLKSKGPKVFIIKKNTNKNKTLEPVLYDFMADQQEVLVDDIKREIEATTLDGDHISYIMQYVDPMSLQVLDSMPEDDTLRISTYKRIYYTLSQIKAHSPELLNRKDRFIFSKQFFLSDDVFALYNRSRREFFITSPELIMLVMDPEEALEYYKEKYNICIRLDPDEIGDSFISPRAPDIDLDELDKEDIQYVAITLTPVDNRIGFNPEVYDPNESLFSLDLKNYVDM